MFINYFSNMMVESNMNESDLYTGFRFKVSAKRPGEAGIVPTATVSVKIKLGGSCIDS